MKNITDDMNFQDTIACTKVIGGSFEVNSRSFFSFGNKTSSLFSSGSFRRFFSSRLSRLSFGFEGISEGPEGLEEPEGPEEAEEIDLKIV